MRILLILLGTVSLALGVIGIFVPLLPTTPFLLLSAAAYARSSARLYGRLLSHPCLGRYIRQFREHKAIPLYAKIVSVAMLWLTIGYGILFLGLSVWLRIALGLIAAGVTWHILSFKTLKK
jgi:uncharacterized membrane protein YbaN (DUF454 family)